MQKREGPEGLALPSARNTYEVGLLAISERGI